MRKIRHHTARTVALAIAAGVMTGAAFAQGGDTQLVPVYPPYVPPSQSSVYNQNSVYLPTPPVAHGNDMVRGSTGVSCQSAVGSGGPYLDVGLIGSQDVFNRETASVYGRIVVPLGDRPKRPDCTKLYELEIARMRMELDLLRMGLPPQLGGVMTPQPSALVQEEPAGEPLTINPPSEQVSKRSSSSPDRHGGGMGEGFETIFKFAPAPQLKPQNKPAETVLIGGRPGDQN